MRCWKICAVRKTHATQAAQVPDQTLPVARPGDEAWHGAYQRRWYSTVQVLDLTNACLCCPNLTYSKKKDDHHWNGDIILLHRHWNGNIIILHHQCCTFHEYGHVHSHHSHKHQNLRHRHHLLIIFIVAVPNVMLRKYAALLNAPFWQCIPRKDIGLGHHQPSFTFYFQ